MLRRCCDPLPQIYLAFDRYHQRSTAVSTSSTVMTR